jgi:flagellar assembly protein FliH
MSVKLFKTQSEMRFLRFTLPEVGAAAHAEGITGFDFPLASSAAVPAQRNSPEMANGRGGFFQNAEAEAEQILADAQRQAETIRAAAREKGLLEARAEMSAEVEAQVADLREQLAETIAAVSRLHGEISRRAEQEMVELALEIARKIVRREAAIDREIALTLARVTLERLDNRAVASLHLHPEDFAYISACRERLDFHGTLELIEDRSIGIGGCLVRTDLGDVDARLEAQFDEISRGLLGDK